MGSQPWNKWFDSQLKLSIVRSGLKKYDPNKMHQRFLCKLTVKSSHAFKRKEKKAGFQHRGQDPPKCLKINHKQVREVM